MTVANKVTATANESTQLAMGRFESGKGNCEMSPYESSIYRTFRRFVWIFPLLFALFVPVFCFSIYSYAARHGHLEPILQYVSDSGTYSPSAGYFSMGLDLMALFVFATAYARYKQHKYYFQVAIPQLVGSGQAEYSPSLLRRLEKLNYAMFLLLLLNVVSILIVGNFRCNESFLMHAIGAIFMFTSSFVCYCCLTYNCRKLSSCFNIESPPVSMFIGIAVQLLSLLGCFVFSTVAMYQFGIDNFFDEYKRLHWTEEQPGYWWHVLGTASEWIMINGNSIFFMCLFRRMRLFREWHKVEL